MPRPPSQLPRPRLRRLRFAHVLGVLAVVAVIGFSISGGNKDKSDSAADTSVNSGKQAAAKDSASGVDLSSALKVRSLHAQEKTKTIVLYGATEPNRFVELKAETSGAVQSIPAKEGQMLKAGDVIVRIEQRDRPARLEQAQAVLRQREIEFKAAERLQAKGFQTEVRYAQAKAQLAEARANLKTVQIDLEHTQLRAPFDGVLERLNVEEGDFVGVGVFGGEGSLAKLVDFDPIKIIGQISENDRAAITLGGQAMARFPGGQELPGTISYLASVAAPESRTFRVEIEVANPDNKIPAGTTAELRLPANRMSAYFVPSSVLVLDDAGKVGVKTVDEEGLVAFMPVSIIEDQSDGVWISGLPDQINLITLGQAFVSPGQRIDRGVLAKLLLQEAPKHDGSAPIVTQ